jgi:hypothetical protein
LIELRSRVRNPDHPALPEHRGKIVKRKDGDNAGQLARGACINGADECVGVRTAYESRVEHARRGNVIDKARAAGQQRIVLKAWNTGPDPVAHWPSLAIAFFARSMTSFGVL